MFWLIEENEQLETLQRLGYRDAFIEVIPVDHIKHPKENYISLIYLYPKYATKGYIISINHSEAFSLKIKDVINVLKDYDILYCKDKKTLLHYLPLRNLWDMSPKDDEIKIPKTKTHDEYYWRNQNIGNLNYIIPISKHYEYLEKLYKNLKPKLKKVETPYNLFFNNKVSLVFAYIENAGLKIDNNIFEDFFYDTGSDYTYVRYNLKTTTTRPSNSYRNVNYAALNKSNGCRKSFIPRNDYLVEFDFKAYHPTLVAKMIGYDFKGEDVHEYFSKLYGSTYAEAKELTFKQIYGNIFPEYEHLEFFQKTKKLINKIWYDFNKKGYYECPTSHFRFTKVSLENMNPQKLFNYFLQQTETTTNVLILWDLIQVLNKYETNTKMVLYTYDSILFDVGEDDEIIMDEIKEVFKKYQFSFKETKGLNYNEMFLIGG